MSDKVNNKNQKSKREETITSEKALEKYKSVIQGAEGGENEQPLLDKQVSDNPDSFPNKTDPGPVSICDDSVPPGPPTVWSSLLSWVKIAVFVVLIFSMWVRNANQREESKALLKFLMSRNQIPLKWPMPIGSDTSIPDNIKSFVEKDDKRYANIIKGTNQTDNQGNAFDKKGSTIWGATKELIAYEFGDQTFLIVLIFTMGWSNPLWGRRGNIDRPGYAVFADGRTVINHRLTYVAPTRIFNLATIGVLYMSWKMVGEITPNQVNNWIFKSSGILVFILLNYAFRLASVHFSAVTKLQVQYEAAQYEQTRFRDQIIEKWSRGDIDFSKYFTDMHKKIVFRNFVKANKGQHEKDSKQIINLTNNILNNSKVSIIKEFDEKADDGKGQKEGQAEQSDQLTMQKEEQDSSTPGTNKPADNNIISMKEIQQKLKEDQFNTQMKKKFTAQTSKYKDNLNKWSQFKSHIADNFPGIKYDENKCKKTLILYQEEETVTDSSGKTLKPETEFDQATTPLGADGLGKKRRDKSTELIYPKKSDQVDETTWSNIPADKIQYNMLNGDTLGDLYTKLMTAKDAVTEQVQQISGVESEVVHQGPQGPECFIDAQKPEKSDENPKNEDKNSAVVEEKKEQEEIFNNLDEFIVLTFGETKITTIIRFALSIIKVAFTDLFFIIFISSQELMDSSNMHLLNIKPFYTQQDLSFAIFFSKVFSNLLLITVVYYFSAKFITVYEGHCIGVLAIYLICAYEFILNVLLTLGVILGLK